jgi:AcrR family transcriptional regulator
MRKSKPSQEDAPTRIIHATLALIAEKGSDALRTREILERAAVTNLSAISYYFGSLENLRLRALECYFEGARPVIAGINSDDDPRQALLGYCRRMSRFVLDNPSLERNIVFLAMSDDPAASVFARILNENLQALQCLILRGRKESDPDKAALDAIVLASATIYPLLLASYGSGSVGINALDEADRERYFSNLVALLLGSTNDNEKR